MFTVSKPNLEDSDSKEKLAVVVHIFLQLDISRCCFAEEGKEMYQELQRTRKAIVLLSKPFVKRRSSCRGRRGFI